MNVEHIEVLVEEQSTEAALDLLLPRILGPVTFRLLSHQGKKDLLKSLPAKLRGYAKWLPKSWLILIVVDRDSDDCNELKQRLETIAHDAGLSTKSAPSEGRYRVVNRLAIEELEAWFFGDWTAVTEAYPRVGAEIPLKANYRHPDSIRGGTWEALERILKQAGYFKTGLRKIEAARAIAQKMDPSRNTSPSFQALIESLVSISAT